MDTGKLDAEQRPNAVSVQQHTKLGTAKKATWTSARHAIEHTKPQTHAAHSMLRKESESSSDKDGERQLTLYGKTPPNTSIERRQATRSAAQPTQRPTDKRLRFLTNSRTISIHTKGTKQAYSPTASLLGSSASYKICSNCLLTL